MHAVPSHCLAHFRTGHSSISRKHPNSVASVGNVRSPTRPAYSRGTRRRGALTATAAARLSAPESRRFRDFHFDNREAPSSRHVHPRCTHALASRSRHNTRARERGARYADLRARTTRRASSSGETLSSDLADAYRLKSLQSQLRLKVVVRESIRYSFFHEMRSFIKFVT